MSACHDVPAPFLTQLLEARRLTADLLVQFTKAADASNRAVMAYNDEGTAKAAREAEAAMQAVQADLLALQPILQKLRYAAERRHLEEFDRRFAEYRTLDSTILGLAVENTNLKAQTLSFGPAREAAEGRPGFARAGRALQRAEGHVSRGGARRSGRGRGGGHPGVAGAAHSGGGRRGDVADGAADGGGGSRSPERDRQPDDAGPALGRAPARRRDHRAEPIHNSQHRTHRAVPAHTRPVPGVVARTQAS